MSVRLSLPAAAVAVVLATTPAAASAQMVLTSLDSPRSETFSTWSGLGLTSSPVSGELDSYTWRVEGLSDGDSTWGGWSTAGDFARGSSSGGVSTGGLYAFYANGASNPALGFQPTADDATPGYVTLRVYNQTGVTVDRVEVTFDACYFNDEDRSQSYTLQYSTDDATYTDTTATSFTPEVSSPSPTWTCLPFTATMTGLALPNLSYLYVRWYTHDNGGTGSRDEVAIDDVTVTALGECSSSADCDDGEYCTIDTCTGGACVNTPRSAGTACGDGDVCNGDETCNSSGACESGASLDCDDLDPCTADSCDAVTGCAHTPISGCGEDDAGVPDAGTTPDAGTAADAGPGVDAGPGADAGSVTADGGVPGSDGGAPPPRPRTGARRGGCSAAGPADGGAPLGWLLAGLVLLAVRRRHRR